jgi:hypothetical protein
MYKISDFKLAKQILAIACKKADVDFLDLEVKFEEIPQEGQFFGSSIYVGSSSKLTQTIYSISKTVLENFEKIYKKPIFVSDEQKKTTLFLVENFCIALGRLTNALPEATQNHPTIMRLYQFASIWNVMNNIICPLYDKQLYNFKVIAANTPYADVSVLQKDTESREECFIFLNYDVVYEPIQMAYLLCSAIEIHGLSVSQVLKEDIFKSEIKEHLLGAMKLHFKDPAEYNDFVRMLYCLAGSEEYIDALVSEFKKVDIKVAVDKSMNGFDTSSLTGSWWFLGVIEKMLDANRGEKDELHQELETQRRNSISPIGKEWDKAGKDKFTFEKMLRIHDGENAQNKGKIIEKLLNEGLGA